MPLFHIHVTSTDGAITGPSKAVALDGIGAARAHAVETILEAARQKPAPGCSRTVMVAVRDGRGDLAYRDSIPVRGPSRAPEDDAGVWRAMRTMGGAR